MHPLLQERVIDLAHPRPGALLNALDCRLGGEAAVDRRVNPPRPTLVVREHPIGLEDLLMLAGNAELGFPRHVIDLFAHLAESGVDALTFGLDVLGHRMFNEDSRLVENSHSSRHAGDELQTRKAKRSCAAKAAAARAINQPRTG